MQKEHVRGHKTKDHSKLLDFPSKKEISHGYNVKIQVLIPSTTKVDESIPEKEFLRRIQEVRRSMNQKFKGTNRYRIEGSYFSEDKRKTVYERVGIVESFTTLEIYKAKDLKLKSFIEAKKKEWGQESIGFSLESPVQPAQSFFLIK